MNVRTVEAEDLEDILELAIEYIPQLPGGMEYDEDSCTGTFNLLLEGERGTMLVAEDEGKVIGMLGALKSPFFYNNNYTQAHHWFSYVKDSYKGRGIGKLLYKAFDDWSEGVSFQSVGAHINNTSLLDWYEKEGYTLLEYTLIRKT